MINDRFTVSPTLGDNRIVQPSKDALDNDVIREIYTGEQYRRTLHEKKREQEAYREAAQMKGNRAMIGRTVAVVPQMEYIAMQAKYGAGCWSDRGFIKYFNREFPHLSPNKA